jgi:hypothetical protein
MKGGLVSLRDNTSIFDILNREAPHITIEDMQVDSVGGYLYKLIFSRDVPELVSLYPGTPDIVHPTREIIVKFIQINVTGSISEHNDMEVVSRLDFFREITIQSNVYQNSMDIWCEPICPNIINSGSFSRNSIERNLFDSYFITRSIIQTIFSNADIDEIGFIFMELITGAKPVVDAFPRYATNPLIRNLSDIQYRVLKNYAFQLIRLYQLGYIHGDTHLNNAMYLENYDYLENYRVYLIDFGRTTIVGNTPITDIYSYLDEDEDNPGTNYYSFRQMEHFIKNRVGQTEDSIIRWQNKQINKYIKFSKQRFIEKMYNQRLLLDPRLLNLYQTHTNLTFTNTDFIFQANEIPLRTYTLSDDFVLYMNSSNNCCLDMSMNNTNIYVGIDNEFRSYGQPDVTFLKRNPEVFRTYVDDEFLQYNIPSGIFLWVIGMRAGSLIPSIFFIVVQSCFEFGTKHLALMQHYGISSIYAAGEMLKNGNVLTFNFLSGTFMIYEFLNPPHNITQEILDRLNNVLIPFVTYKLNTNPAIQYDVRLTQECINLTVITDQTSFINEVVCCGNRNAKNIQLEYIRKVNEYYSRNGQTIPFYGNIDNRIQQCSKNDPRPQDDRYKVRVLQPFPQEQPPTVTPTPAPPTVTPTPATQVQPPTVTPTPAPTGQPTQQISQRRLPPRRNSPLSPNYLGQQVPPPIPPSLLGPAPSPPTPRRLRTRRPGPQMGGGIINGLSLSIQNDIKIADKYLVTINNLYKGELDIELYKKITNDTNVNLQKNLQILNGFARISCMNSYNNCLNTIVLYDSDIKEKIVLIGDGVSETSQVSDIELPNKIDSVKDDTSKNHQFEIKLPTNKYSKSIDIPVRELSKGISTGGVRNKKKSLRKKKCIRTKRRNKTNRRNKTKRRLNR